MRPLHGYKVDSKKQLGHVLNDLLDNSCRISQYIGDNPKRSDAKDVKNHASWHPCEYCYAKGTKIELSGNLKTREKLTQQIQLISEKICECETYPDSPYKNSQIENLTLLKDELQKSLNCLKKKSNILWPASTMNCTHRSRQSILDIIEKIENNEKLNFDESKGIKGRSLLLDIPNFNFVYDVPAEYLHSGCLGVIKRLVCLTFNVGERRPRITKRKLSSTQKFNELMSVTKVTKEFPRRGRSLDFSVFKGLEFRNIGIFFFILVLDCIEPEAKERHLWLYLAYMMRSSVLPSKEYAAIKIEDVIACCEKFYYLFEELFGIINCPYNLHVFCSHLTEIRTHGPLTETSAFKFESFYGEVRKSFVPGTVSPLKQIMKKVLIKRALRTHTCTNKIFISNYNTSLECNNLVYTYVGKAHKIYQVSKMSENSITCQKIGQYEVSFPETPEINWSNVGLFEKGGISSEVVEIPTSQIAGKVVQVKNYLLTCPINVLNEK